MYIYTYYCIFIHKTIKGVKRRVTRAGAFSLVYTINAFIYALVRLYLYIIILFFYLKNSSMHSLIILSLIILYLVIYLLPKVSYIYFTYRIRARGFRVVGAFWGVFLIFGAFLAVVSAIRSFCGWSAGVGGVLRACSGVFSRACGRAGVYPCHFSRAPNPSAFTLS